MLINTVKFKNLAELSLFLNWALLGHAVQAVEGVLQPTGQVNSPLVAYPGSMQELRPMFGQINAAYQTWVQMRDGARNNALMAANTAGALDPRPGRPTMSVADAGAAAAAAMKQDVAFDEANILGYFVLAAWQELLVAQTQYANNIVPTAPGMRVAAIEGAFNLVPESFQRCMYSARVAMGEVTPVPDLTQPIVPAALPTAPDTYDAFGMGAHVETVRSVRDHH